jgi:K(+)-stimulated pyrophosphate-energized sodium pump
MVPFAGLSVVALGGCAATPPSGHGGGDANLRLPDLASVPVAGMDPRILLVIGVVVCLAGLAFSNGSLVQLKRRPAHASMLEVAQLIYETCRTYVIQQGRFLLTLWGFIAVVIFVYFLFFAGLGLPKTLIVLAFSVLGMLGSVGIAMFGIRVNTIANSRAAFAALKGKPYEVYYIPLRSGMSIGMMLISMELLMLLAILLIMPADVAGACFVGFAVGESLGASALRIAGGIFTKIADIGSDLMKIVFKIKEDDARNPGVIADCAGDNAGDSVGPSADGFETYGVTSVAMVTFIVLAVKDPTLQVQLLVWLFFLQAMMVVASFLSYQLDAFINRVRFGSAAEMDFEEPLTYLVWITSLVSIAVTYGTTYALLSGLPDGMWWKLATIMSCGTLAGALIPALVKVFTSVTSKHTHEVVKSSAQGGASLNILSGLVAGNYSAFWLGLSIMGLMAMGFGISTLIPPTLMLAPAIFAFGLVAVGFLAMGPVTIAVDSYGPVTDNAQSVYELSVIETLPDITAEIESDYGFTPDWDGAKRMLELNDGAGNTFKATAKPVLIGTAVVGSTTMIFSIIMSLTQGLENNVDKLSLLHAPFLLGIVTGGAVIYWFTGASIQAVTAGAFQAVEFIKENIKLDESVTKASVEDSKRVVEICTTYAQRGMFTIFLGVFFATLAGAFADPFFFIGYLVSIALFGLYQAIFMANAGGAWDNAKKLVEVDLRAKGTPMHDAAIVGDTVGDPYKDTSSVALNPVIKFTTLFGLLAVELAVSLTGQGQRPLVWILAGVMLIVALVFVLRSFYAMRIPGNLKDLEYPVLRPAAAHPRLDAPVKPRPRSDPMEGRAKRQKAGG